MIRRIRSVAWMMMMMMAPTAAWADDAQDLAEQSIAACERTAADARHMTPEMVVEKIEAAAALIEARGEGAFAEFRGGDSAFIFCGTHVWVHDLEGTMLVQPLEPNLEGQRLLTLRDDRGKPFIADMNRIAMNEGSGWLEYLWPRRGQTDASATVAFVKLARHGERTYIVGCATQDLSIGQVAASLALAGE